MNFPFFFLQTLDYILHMQGSTKFPCRLFAYLERGIGEVKEAPIPDYCVLIPRLLITPSQTKMVGMAVEMSNRVIRSFVKEHGFHRTSFLRVQVGEENGDKLYVDEVTESIEKCIKETVINGVMLNGKLYQFLAFSSSQLKECSLWMVYPEFKWTIEKMRRALGDFSQCPTAAKYAARIGQCFSTTIEGQPIHDEDTSQERLRCCVIDDIKAGSAYPSMFHSDGTGLISRSLMSDLLDGLPLAPHNPEDASIIQIRYGGAKGTLVAWDIDEIRDNVRPLPLPSGYNIFLRKSMTKFEAKYTNVEVCCVGSTVPYYLNRNVILLLCCQGVDERIFLNMQRNMLDNFDKMLIRTESAARVLPRLSGPDSTSRSTLLHMIDSGLSPASEPFLFSCLHAIRSHHLFSLRKKARILVEEGAVLIGGLDETGLLPEGCVFIQISERTEDPRLLDRPFKIIKGAVMVTKHPVMHPGDARMLLAVDTPALRKHKNVILFSQHGNRPEANKMSGSDLDGDEFAVTWDKRLFLKKWNNCTEEDRLNATVEGLAQANCTPMQYEPPSAKGLKPLPLREGQRTRALLDHFVDHLKSDNLGRISMLWQDYASWHGAGCDQCIQLAELHSIAVDFPKSGVPAVIPDELRNLRFQRAHWREVKGDKNPRHCSSVIGKLYDEVIRRGDWKSAKTKKAMAGRETDQYGLILSSRRLDWQDDQDNDAFDHIIPARLGFEVSDDCDVTCERMIQTANSNRIHFEGEINTVMNKYKVRSEGEVHTGCIRKYHKSHKKRQRDISEEIRRWCRDIRSYHRKEFFATVVTLARESFEQEGIPMSGGERTAETEEDDFELINESSEVDSDVVDQAMAVATSIELTHPSPWEERVRKTAFRLAAAYYIVAYSSEYRDNDALFGFPWIVAADVISAGLREEGRLRSNKKRSQK